jgi:hypothetical protein
MASEREQLKSLIDRIPDDQLPPVRAALESLLHESPRREAPPTPKKYPERTPVGGIITPQ